MSELEVSSSGPLRLIGGIDANGKKLEELKGYSSTIVGLAFKDGKPVVVSGTEQAEVLGSVSAVNNNLRSIMAVPLTIRGKTLGVVYLDSKLTKGLFTGEDLELLSAISTHIAVAFETARMARIELEKANLQKELEIQNAVAAEAKKVQLLVDNMQQALFSIDSSGTIVEPVSRFSEKVLGQKVTGENIVEVLYKNLDLQKIDAVRSGLMGVFGEDDLQWTLMEDSFPPKIVYPATAAGTNGAASPRTLKIQTSPIWDVHEKLEKILYVIEDVTVFEALESQMKESRAQARIFEDLMDKEIEEVREFFINAILLVGGYEKDVASTDANSMASLLRDLHTLKGNARLFGIKQLSEQVHDSESAILASRAANAENEDAIFATVREELANIKRMLDQYSSVVAKLQRGSSAGAGASINELAQKQLENIVSEMSKFIGAERTDGLMRAIRRLTLRSAKDLFGRYDSMVQDVARQLNKKVRLTVEGDALLDSQQFQMVQESCLHLIRNAIDHGIEMAEERMAKGKPETGNIRVRCADEVDTVTISISDDGKGMDENMIVKKAIEKGLVKEAEARALPREEKLGLILAAGFSTKDTASDISGRGIGMDVVKQNIAKIDGTLKFETEVNKGSLFTIVIRNDSMDTKISKIATS